MMKSVRDLGYSVVTWDVDPNDWKHPAALIIENGVLHHVHSGSIILLHDGLRTFESPDISSTLKALPILITDLRNRGFEFATISELRGSQGPILAAAPQSSQSSSH